MKPAIELFVGAPLVHGSEVAFLSQLISDLQSHGPAVILANFEAKLGSKSHQIDFVVVTTKRGELVELKALSGRIDGGENGSWTIYDSAGHVSKEIQPNPWIQARDAKMQLSDAMHLCLKQSSPILPPPAGGRFFKQFGAGVCVYGSVDSRSKLTSGNHKVSVYGYDKLLKKLTTELLSSSWQLEDWRNFAKALNLKPSSLAAAIDPTIAAAESVVSSYLTRVESVLKATTGPLLEADEAGDMSGERLISLLLGPGNHLLLGKSGLGKTHHVCHLSLAAHTAGRLPIQMDVRHYTGSFEKAIAKSLQPYTNEPKALLTGMKSVGIEPLLIVDGLNYCNQLGLSDLLKDLAGFQLQYGGKIVATSQFSIEVQTPLRFLTVELAELRPETKRQIYAYHSGLSVSSASIDHMCEGFSTGYDLVVAAMCNKKAGKELTRCELYDRYCDEMMPDGHKAATAVLLRECAAAMDGILSYSLLREKFSQIMESYCVQENLPFSLIDRISDGRLLRIFDDVVYFEHDLLRDYFSAEHLRRRCADVHSLAIELSRPRYFSAAEFVLPRYSSDKELESLLRGVISPSTLSNCINGQLGEMTRAVILQQCVKLVHAAVEDLQHIQLEYRVDKSSDSEPVLSWPRISNHREWTSYDILLCDVMAQNFNDALICQSFAELLRATEARLHALATQMAAMLGTNSRRAWGPVLGIVGNVGMTTQDVSLPVLRIFATWRMKFKRFRVAHDRAAAFKALLNIVDHDSVWHFALLVLLDSLTYSEITDVDRCLRLLLKAWQSGFGQLRSQALHMIHSVSGSICTKYPESVDQVISELEQMNSKNIWISSAIVEALAAYGGLEQPVEPESAVLEAKEILDLATNPEMSEKVLQEQAHHFLSLIFEEVYQNVYYDAYNGLDATEKLRLLALALTEPKGDFLNDWITQELLRLDTPEALPIFRKLASLKMGDASFLQSAIASHVLGIAGCAKYNDHQWEYGPIETPDDMAWSLIGKILFAQFRPFHALDKSTSAPLWHDLFEKVPFAVADVLFSINSAAFQLDLHGQWDLTKTFPNEARRCMEFSLQHLGQLTSVFKFGGSTALRLITFLIATLGRVGTEGSVPILASLAEDPTWGTIALDAIRKIRSGVKEIN